MKHLKTYEDMVSFDLDEEEKMKLIEMAIEKDNINILKSLLDTGYLPDFIDGQQSIITIQSHIENSNSLDMIKLFIDHGYDIDQKDKDGNTSLINSIFNFKKNSDVKFLKMLEIIIGADADTTIINDDGEDFYDILDYSLDRIIKKSLKQDILNLIKIKKPDQYEYYLMRKNMKKYNI